MADLLRGARIALWYNWVVEFDPDKIRKVVRIYRVAKATGSVLEQKARLADALHYQKRSMDTIIDVADVAARAANADLTGEDIRATAKATLKHGPRVASYLVRYIRQHRQSDDG